MTENNEFDDILSEVKKARELDQRHTDLLMKEHNIDASKRLELELMKDEEREAKAKEYADSNDATKKEEPGQVGKRIARSFGGKQNVKESHYFRNNSNENYFN